MTDTVIALRGGPTGRPEPNQACIDMLESWLEMARSGELIGVTLAGNCFNGCARWGLAGTVGGYSMIGALEIARAELVNVARGEE